MSAPAVSRAKMVAMNAAVLVALLYRYWKGAPIQVILMVGAFMLLLVNGVMFLAARKSASRTNP